MPQGRRAKRVKNRLAKRGLILLRFEPGDCSTVTIRAITEHQGVGRAMVFPAIFINRSGPRVVADAILYEHIRRAA
jgi:hypothetical protein